MQTLYQLAHEIADAMAADAAKPLDSTEFLHASSVVCRVRVEVASMLCGCFAPEPRATPPSETFTVKHPLLTSKDATRISARACEDRLISLWNAVYAPKQWSAYRATLPGKTLSSQFQVAFSTAERQGTYHRLV